MINRGFDIAIFFQNNYFSPFPFSEILLIEWKVAEVWLDLGPISLNFLHRAEILEKVQGM